MRAGAPAVVTPASNDTRTAIADLLAPLSIRRLIVVDDDIDLLQKEAALDSVLGNLANLHEELATIAVDHPDFSLTNIQGELVGDDEAREIVRREWPNFENATRLDLVGKSDTGQQFGVTALTAVADQLPPGLDYVPLSVQEWTDNKDQYLGAGHPGTIVFFDRDLTKAKKGKTGGDVLVKELYGRSLDGVFSGIFTNEVTDDAAEMKLSETLTRKIKKAVPALAKAKTRDAQLFVAGLQVFLHIQHLYALKKHAEEALKFAFAAAEDRVGSVGFYAIMAAAASANDEGVTESDGLIRLARSQFRRSAIVHLREKTPTKSLDWIRKASTNSISSQLPKSEEADRLAWEERFDDGIFLNAAAAPTEVGDVYEITDHKGAITPYILLAQPCDLMVRADGKRANSPESFALAKLQELSDGQDVSERLIDIGPLRVASEKRWVVNLARRIYLAPQLLDACVLSSDGKSSITSSLKSDDSLAEGWQKMPAKLKAWRGDRLAAAKEISKLLPAKSEDFLEQPLVIQALQQSAFGSDFSNGRIDLKVDGSGNAQFGIRRIQRLVEAHAKALLLQYSHYQARPDSPNDLTRDNPRSLTGV